MCHFRVDTTPRLHCLAMPVHYVYCAALYKTVPFTCI